MDPVAGEPLATEEDAVSYAESIATPLPTPTLASASPFSRSREEVNEPQASAIAPHHRENGPRKLLRRLTGKLKKPIAPSRQPSTRLPPRTPILESIDLPSSPSAQDIAAIPSLPTRPHIKIRLVTHNMHDSLPSGDLTEFLGEIKGGFRGRQMSTSTGGAGLSTAGSALGSTAGSILHVPSPANLPTFPLSASHPYHLIVVAGQECPTASGVLAGKMRTLDGRGWTSMLEDWLCGESDSAESVADAESMVAPSESLAGESESVASRATTSADRDDEEEEDDGVRVGGNRKGPYILVEKGRLLGIYLAVFVHRSSQNLADGASVGRVTAGLIGGRLGNKGGVGISLAFAGSRLLFISAHLAAHAHHLEMRKANVKKILDELEVDDFLGDGPKSGMLTERFDQTFFMGDLNFRLNVSRLHADWIVKSKDYATALEFDQLREVLAEPQSVFAGFNEAPIAFAPTYKYDIVRQVKKRRSTMLSRNRGVPAAPKKPREWKAFEPADLSEIDGGATSDPEMLQATRDGAQDDDDARSLLSDRSALSDYERVEKTSDLASVSMGLPTAPSKGNATPIEAARKAAHVRFLTLVRTNSAAAAFVQAAKKSNESSAPSSAPDSGASTPRKMTLSGLPGVPLVRPILRSSHSELVVPMERRTVLDEDESSAPPSEDESAPVSASEEPSLKQAIVEACFDSSSKQRVQSYTDRILFKSTVAVPDDPPYSPPAYPRRGSNFVDQIKGFVHNFGAASPADTPQPQPPPQTAPSYFDRPIFEQASEKIREWRDAGSETPGDPYANRSPFLGGSRSGLASRSADSLVPPERSPVVGKSSPGDLKRSKSLQGAGSARRASFAPSVKSSSSQEHGIFSSFRRRSSGTPGLGLSTSSSAVDASSPTSPIDTHPSSPLAASPISASTPLPLAPDATITQRSRKRPTFSVRSSSSSRHGVARSNSLSALKPTLTSPPALEGQSVISPISHGLPRSSTRTSLHRSVSGPAPPATMHTNLSLHRLKSFFHLPSLPFLSHNDRTAGEDGAEESTAPQRVASPPLILGPRKGQIQVIKYDAIADLSRMGMISDHRPVFAVLAVGVGGDPVSGP